MSHKVQISWSVVKRFWSKVQKSTTCWAWTGARFTNGYGQFTCGVKKRYRAHRFAFLLLHGDIPNDLLVLHTCDNPICVNPAHLYLGTHQDNMDDKVRRGRQAKGATHGSKTKPESIPKGERNGGAKLTPSDVRQIRRLFKAGCSSQKELARKFSVSPSQIYNIVSNRCWRSTEYGADI